MIINMQKSIHSGFTLIELMIVVAIVSILSFVAVSNYGDSAIRSKRTDARDALLSISTSIEKCKTIYGSYNNANCNIKNGDSIDSSSGLYSVEVKIPDATSFSLAATPVTGKSQANDSDCLSITLNNLGVQLPVDCW